MRINFVNHKTGEIIQVNYVGEDKYNVLFKALRRKNIQGMIKKSELLIGDVFIENFKRETEVSIEFIE